MCEWWHASASVYMWRLEGNLWESFLSLHAMGLRHCPQVVRLRGAPYLLSHLALGTADSCLRGSLAHWPSGQWATGSFWLSPLSYRQACSAFYMCDRDAESGPQACTLSPTEDIHKLSNASSPAPLIEKLDSIHQCHLSFPKSLVCTRCLLLCLHTACRHVQLSCHLQSSHSK